MKTIPASGLHAAPWRTSVLCWLELFLLMLLATGANAATNQVRIGVLAFFGKAEAQQQWQPTGQVLAHALGDRPVQIVPLNYEELSEAVAGKTIDFVFTNPEHFVVLRKAYNLTALATLNAKVNGQVVDRFGSVIFTRASEPNIHNLEDVRGKRVCAVGLYSLGGFLLAADMFRAAGIDLRSNDVAQLVFAGLPHPQVVERVLADQADVGIVRTGVLEEMARQGKIDLASIRILNIRPESAFPQRLSSDLSPEWPLATLAQTDPAVVKTVTATLLNLTARDPAAIAGHFEGFSPPASYAPIEDMMRRLHVFPRLGSSTMLIDELWYEYDGEIVMALALLTLGGLGLSAYLIHSNQRLQRLSQLYFEAKAGLQTTAAAFDSQIGLIITDQQTRILRANQAFSNIFGYDETELQGQTTAFLRGSSLPHGLLGTTWQQLQRDGRWSGELICSHRNGTEVPCMISITVIQEREAGLEGFVGSFVDMSQHHRDQAAIRQLAFYDVLTGLPNRRMFLEQLDNAVRTAQQRGQHGALLFIDLDHFKTLNDAHGHTLGDQLLTQVADRLRLTVGDRGLVARLGGDEFVVLLERLGTVADLAQQQALDMARRLREAILQPCQLSALMDQGSAGGSLQHRCSASIGLAVFGIDKIPTAEIMKRADIAMYQAKQAGRDTIRSYDPKIQQLLTERAVLAADLSRALSANELVPYYQVQVDQTGRAVGAECLLRWMHPHHGMVQPTRFIPIAEETGAIVAIGDWVIEQACTTLARWALIPAIAHLELSVNVSPRQFIEADFVDKLKDTLQRSTAQPRRLVLEITEGIVMDRADEVAERMQELCKLGINLSIDDFGTGYSSLSYLQRLPLRQLKIDRSFIRDIEVNQNSEAIVRAIIALGTSMGLMIVAEGVETEQQQRLLISLGSDMLQGYHVGEPIALADFEKIILGKV
jgi:diguanylate cyclase (GGDEF)-like protein/PAS domain S-box-containing protein